MGSGMIVREHNRQMCLNIGVICEEHGGIFVADQTKD